MQILKFALLAILCLSAQSCIQGDEDVWIEADGSARVKATYRVPAMLLTEAEAAEFVQSVQEEVGANKNLRLVTNRVDKEKGRRLIRIEIETDDITELENITVDHAPGEKRSKPDKILHAILGSIEVETHGLGAAMKREVNLNPLMDEYLGKNASVMLSDANFRYAVHLPQAVEQSNAHDVSGDGKTLRWAYNLAELKGKPIVMTMKASVPLPWWVYLIAVAVVLLIAGGVWKFVASRSKRTAQAAKA